MTQKVNSEYARNTKSSILVCYKQQSKKNREEKAWNANFLPERKFRTLSRLGKSLKKAITTRI